MVNIKNKIIKRIYALLLHLVRQKAYFLVNSPDYKLMEDINVCFNIATLWNKPSYEYIQNALKSYKNVIQLKKFKKEHSAAVNLIKMTKLINPKILGVGSSIGIYTDIFQITNTTTEYFGCDISDDLIKIAKEIHPEKHEKFSVQDAVNLNEVDQSYDIVIIEGTLEYIKEYKECIKEAVRVAKYYVLFHRVTIVHEYNTMFYQRNFNNMIFPEIHFNEEDLLKLFNTNKLVTVCINTQKVSHIQNGIMVFIKSYLCKKEF